MNLPTLTRCNSWVCTSPTGRALEFFTPANAQKALDAGWQVETCADYLERINAAILAAGSVS